MPAAAFDTLRLARRLQGIGLPHEQAAGFAEAFADTMVSELATKADLASLGADLRAELRLECEKLRSERSEILRWVVPLILAQLALSVGVLLRIAG